MGQSVVVQGRVGGMIADGVARDGARSLAVPHDGRGTFECATGCKIARGDVPDAPSAGTAIGIDPIEGERVAVVSGRAATIKPFVQDRLRVDRQARRS